MRGNSLEHEKYEQWRVGYKWLRGLDSNQDNQLQRLACYQLHYPGVAQESVADIF
jgi:hypothetical protein